MPCLVQVRGLADRLVAQAADTSVRIPEACAGAAGAGGFREGAAFRQRQVIRRGLMLPIAKRLVHFGGIMRVARTMAGRSWRDPG